MVRAITGADGSVVRHHGAALVAAFTESDYGSPIASALAVSHALAQMRCRIVLHATSALVRRSAAGKQTLYGEDLERIDGWIPRVPFSGVLLTAAAAGLSDEATVPAVDVPGFFRVQDRIT